MGIRGLKTWDDTQTWLSAAGTVNVGSYTAGGVWTLGPTSAAAGSTNHRIYGPVHIGGGTFTGIGTDITTLFIGGDIAGRTGAVRVASSNGSVDYGLFASTTSDAANPGGFGAFSNHGLRFLANSVLIGSFSSTGLWTFGPSGSSVTHVFNGQLQTTTAATATNSFISSGGVSQLFVQSGSASFGAYTTYRKGATSFSELGTDSTNTGMYFGMYNPTFAYVGNISLTGVWTIGPTSSNTIAHRINGSTFLDSTPVSFSSSAFRWLGTDDGGLLLPQTNDTTYLYAAGYYNGTNSVPKTANTSIARFFMAGGSANASAFIVFQKLQTSAGSYTISAGGIANASTELGSCTHGGQWSFGAATEAVNANHTFTSGLQTTLTVKGNASSNAFIHVDSGTGGVAYLKFSQGTTQKWEFGNDAGAAAGGGVNAWYFYNHTNSKYVGTIGETGTWTLGPGAGTAAVGLTHKIQSNGTTIARLRAATGNECELAFDINDVVQYKWSLTSTTLRLLDSTNAIIGSIAQGGSWTVGPAAGTANTPHSIHNRTTTAGNGILDFVKVGVAQNTSGNIYATFSPTSGQDGTIQVVGTTLTLTDGSDSRIKENVVDATYGLTEIMALRPVEFDFIGGPTGAVGFIAQEVAAVLPDCVAVNDESVKGGFADMHYISTTNMIPYLVKALQQLKEQFDDYVAAHP